MMPIGMWVVVGWMAFVIINRCNPVHLGYKTWSI